MPPEVKKRGRPPYSRYSMRDRKAGCDRQLQHDVQAAAAPVNLPRQQGRGERFDGGSCTGTGGRSDARSEGKNGTSAEEFYPQVHEQLRAFFA
jgi:hypothetical protein